MAARRQRGGRQQRKRREKPEVKWEPKTKLGLLVANGKITTMHDALTSGLPIRESEIADILLPDLDDEVLDVNMVQRMTDSGRRVKFVITVVVGNKNGFVGLGQAKGKEVGASIRKAIDNAKLHIMEIRRGCGSWECGCGKPHTVPFSITGKSGSVKITLKPAPQGIGLATGDVAKKVLTIAGVKDCWAYTEGQTQTTVNYAKAVMAALEKNIEMRMLPHEKQSLGVVVGATEPPVEEEPVVDEEAR